MYRCRIYLNPTEAHHTGTCRFLIRHEWDVSCTGLLDKIRTKSMLFSASHKTALSSYRRSRWGIESLVCDGGAFHSFDPANDALDWGGCNQSRTPTHTSVSATNSMMFTLKVALYHVHATYVMMYSSMFQECPVSPVSPELPRSGIKKNAPLVRVCKTNRS